MLIGVCLERSVAMLASLLAVLKTGAAYVPLDPRFPAARLDLMIKDSGVGLLVVSGDVVAFDHPGAPVIDLAKDAGLIGDLDDADLGIVPAGTDPAYVIYTSGSTGRPNGVVVPHSAFSNFLGAMLREPGLSARDVLAAVTTISFDIAGLELYLPLIVGARVVLVARDVAADGIALATLLSEERVTIMQATPATWRILIEAGWSGGSDFTALCGGDALPPDLADELALRVGALWNLYGPTETTIWSTAGRILPGSGQVTVGRPIANTRVLIVNRAGEPVPVGIPGEIWIGGAGVALGYHRNLPLTSRKFGNDPFAGPAGSRVYRTGDLGRWLSDGRIVHMGRLDQQVKLRGFRIEPAEIEAALTAHPAIRQAAVVLQAATAETPRLVAYVVYRSDAELTSSETRAHLRGLLPEYMVPSVFVALDELPMTPNGKIDRNALPAPFRQTAATSSAYLPPAPGAEQLVARIWMDLLKVDRVGANDNFFDLGGHSLLALRAAARVNERTGWRIQPRDLFTQTLGQLAASLQVREAVLRADR
jgi:amino acid adenylation domain-containing protein